MDSRKYAEREFRKRGVPVTNRDATSVLFTFPNGHRLTISRMHSLKYVTEQVAKFDAHDSAISHNVVREDAPAVDIAKVKSSAHFRSRLILMREQGMADDELTSAVLQPVETRWSDFYESWLYVRDRVAVAVGERDGRQVFVTVLWTRHSIWAENPRPEKQRSEA